jgi:creatinine amidohydrolase/Fe(II)-dependent formamide hydrolase-like protein
MTALGHAALRQLALKVLAQHGGSAAAAEAVAAAARRAYDDLARVTAPLIGQVGIDALTGRALHLAQQEYPWLVHMHAGTPASTERAPATPPPEQAEGPFARVIVCLERQNPAVATEAAGAVLATFTGLLVTFIGEPLTARLLRKASPDAFADANTEET